MKISVLALLIALPAAAMLYAQSNPLEQADSLDNQGRYESARTVLVRELQQAGGPALQADIYARLARENLNIGDRDQDAGKAKDSVIAVYEQGVSYADKAIAADPGNPEGYFWKSGNIGKIGLLKGVMVSLDSVPTIKELLTRTIALNHNHAKAWYALGQMYAKLPGWPISFGSVEHAVSLTRKAVDLQEQDIRTGLYKQMDYGFYLELATDLHRRNWDARKRSHEQVNELAKFREKSDVVEKNFYYEGTVSIPNMSDRQEASALLQRTIRLIEQKPNPTDRDLRTLRDAKKALSDWG